MENSRLLSCEYCTFVCERKVAMSSHSRSHNTGGNQKSREPRSKIKEDGSALGKVGEAANSLLGMCVKTKHVLTLHASTFIYIFKRVDATCAHVLLYVLTLHAATFCFIFNVLTLHASTIL